MVMNQFPLDVQLKDDEAFTQLIHQHPEAFAELYRCHVNRVYRYVLVRVGNVHDAEELTAQTFLAAFEGIQGYRSEGSFAAWILGIARHKVADYFRRHREALPLEAAVQVASPTMAVDEAVSQKILLEQVTQVLKTLSSERAEAFSLRIFAGLSLSEISQIMGKSEAAIKMLVYRALCDVRERVESTTEQE